jgi:hypothetical protein
MSQTKQQQQGAPPAQPTPRKRGEIFWRTIAGLLLLVIVWSLWVLYQITPRSVVTPLAYDFQLKRGGTQKSQAGAAAAALQSDPAKPAAQDGAAGLAVVQPMPDVAQAALLMDQAQAAQRSGAHQSSADVQAAAMEKGIEPVRERRLKLSTEITTPLVEREPIPREQDARPEGAPPVPSATDQAGKVRP